MESVYYKDRRSNTFCALRQRIDTFTSDFFHVGCIDRSKGAGEKIGEGINALMKRAEGVTMPVFLVHTFHSIEKAV